MDQNNREEVRDRAPSWLSRSAPGQDAGRPLFPRFALFQGPTGWLLNLGLLVAFCAVVAALGTGLFREWRPGIFMPGSPLSGLSPLPAVTPRPPDAQASALLPGRSPAALNMELELQARQKAQEDTERRRAAAVRQTEADETAVRRRMELEARREREWRAAYVKPAHCDESKPGTDSIGCANDYIRARRKFDEQFLSSNRR